MTESYVRRVVQEVAKRGGFALSGFHPAESAEVGCEATFIAELDPCGFSAFGLVVARALALLIAGGLFVTLFSMAFASKAHLEHVLLLGGFGSAFAWAGFGSSRRTLVIAQEIDRATPRWNVSEPSANYSTAGVDLREGLRSILKVRPRDTD